MFLYDILAFMLRWIETLNGEILSGLIKGSSLVVFILLSQGIISLLKYRLRRRFLRETGHLNNIEEVQGVSFTYFRRRQILEVIRASLILFSLLMGVLFYNIQAFSFLALALGAVVINQKENLNSITAYFYLLSNYNIGDNISSSGSNGEIVRITLFHTILAGKDENGEYNGKRVSMPNYLFLVNQTEQQEFRANTYQKVTMDIPFDKSTYGIEFDAFIKELREFLNGALPKRNLKQVGSHRGYAGVQYKINFDYDAMSKIIIHLSFISQPQEIMSHKESIVAFVEQLKVKSL